MQSLDCIQRKDLDGYNAAENPLRCPLTPVYPSSRAECVATPVQDLRHQQDPYVYSPTRCDMQELPDPARQAQAQVRLVQADQSNPTGGSVV